MAVDMFLKLEGVKGEAKDDTHKDEIDVLAWSWGGSQSGTMHLGGGAGAGKVNLQDFSFTKYIDKSSSDLWQACCNGKHFGEATLIVRKAGENPLEYLTIVMTDLIISSFSTGGSGGEDRLTENLSLNFAKAKWLYKGQDEKGKAEPGNKIGWDIQKNVKFDG